MPAQITIIDTVNKILSKNDTPVKLNKGGVCGGLASLYVRYTLEGRKDEFFQLSKMLAQLPDHYQIGQDSSIDKFIREIEIEFNLFNYTKGQSYQGDMEHTVLIDGKPIKKEFSLGLIESNDNWAALLEQMNNDGRACYIRSHNHAVALSFVDNHYELYDPNYDEDNEETPNASINNIRTFKTAAEAINELAKQFSYPVDSDVGLGIIVYAHPNETKPANYPDKNQVLCKALKSKIDFQKKLDITGAKRDYNSLFFATYINDKETVSHHFLHNEISIKDCAYLMLMDSNNEIMFNLYSHESSQRNKQSLIYYAIWSGNIDLFQRMTSDYQKNHVTNGLQKQEFKALIQNDFSLLRAAQSGNPVCILSILKLYEHYGIPLSTIGEPSLIQIVDQLTQNGNADLLKSFTQHISPLSESLVLAGISSATEYDKRGALSFWLHLRELQTQTSNSTVITSKLIGKASLLSFQQLIQAGFTVSQHLFSETLKRNRNEFFELSIATRASSQWIGFVQLLKNKTLEEPIDLFSQKEELSVFQVLTSYKENELIKRNWPASVSQQTGADALKFACECGNKEIVEFLTNKGFKVSSAFQMEQLKSSLKTNDHQRLDAVLSSSIDYVRFFTKSNESLITDLIRIGKYEFIISAWSTYQNNQQSKTAAGSNTLDIANLFWIALTQKNKNLYDYFTKKDPDLALQTIKVIIDSNHADYYPYAIKLAQCLPRTSQTHSAAPFYEFIQEEMREYDQLLFNRQTKDDEYADKKFRQNARKLIQPLCTILIYAIEHHYFKFADDLSAQVFLSLDELYDLFVSANQSKNHKAVEFLLARYPQMTTNTPVYIKLAESGKFDSLALLLKRNKPIDNFAYIRLLKLAVRAHHEPVIQLLSRHINSAYKVEGSPMYEAMQEGNLEGCILLLKYDATVQPLQLFSMAIRQKNDRLLQATFERPEFADFFNQNSPALIELLLEQGTPEAILYFYKIINQTQSDTSSNDYFSAFLKYSISANNVVIFKQLQLQEQFAAQDGMTLFKLACQAKAPEIVNDLLKSPLTVNNRQTIHALLDQLFDINNETSPKNAHSIYELIYKRKLNRLYEFVIDTKYRPFASLFHSIDDLVDDPGLTRFKKNHLISRALEESDQNTLDELLKQLETPPELNQDSVSLFKDNLHKPLIIRVLLDHYKLNEVLAKAMEMEDWPTVAVLLKDRTVSELEPSLVAQLKLHDADILNAITAEAKQNLEKDPRHELNNLLITRNNVALPNILVAQREAITKSIMNVQKLMEEQKIDLNSLFYRFDLYDQLVSSNAAMEYLTPKIEQFFARNKGQSAQQIILNEFNLEELREFKTEMDTHKLIPAYFEERDNLDNAFDALTQFDTNQRQQEQDALRKQQQEQDALRKLQQEQDALHKQQQEQDALHKQQQEQDALLKQQQEQDALRKLQQEQDALRKQQQEQDALRKQQQKSNIQEKPDDKSTSKQEIKKEECKTNPLSGLIAVINIYSKERKNEYFTHFLIPFFQYTRTDKLNAATQLINALQNPTHIISAKNRAVLNNGRLQKRINEYLTENEQAIQSHFNLDKPIKSVNQLINVLNKQDPMEKLINLLQQYHTHRSKQPEMYHFALFPQYTGTDKRRAVTHLIAHLKGQFNALDSKDIGALKQGTLGTMISDFIADFKIPLKEALGAGRITNLNDLISACEQKQKGASLGQ
jgi:hypothetical protein